MLVPTQSQLQRNHLPLICVHFLLFVLLVSISITISAENATDAIKLSDPEKEVTVQPNGYFEFSAEHHLNKKLITYGDLIDLIYEVTEEKVATLQDAKSSQSEAERVDGADLEVEQSPNRPARAWKRRILVLLDGERVTGTADRSMQIEGHLGISLTTVETLEGFLSDEVDPNQIAYPRVLNFVTKHTTHQESDSTKGAKDTKVDELDEGNPQVPSLIDQQS